MKRLTLAISVIVVWFAIAGTYYVCVIKGLCDHIPEAPIVAIDSDKKQISEVEIQGDSSEKPIIHIEEPDFELANTVADTLYSYPLEIYYDGELVSDFESNFKITKNDSIVEVSDGLASYKEIIKQKIETSDDSEITILSYYSSNEDPIIGFKRAVFIKEELKKINIPEEKIKIIPQIAFIDFDAENIFEGGIELSFENFDEDIYDSETYNEEQNSEEDDYVADDYNEEYNETEDNYTDEETVEQEEPITETLVTNTDYKKTVNNIAEKKSIVVKQTVETKAVTIPKRKQVVGTKGKETPKVFATKKPTQKEITVKKITKKGTPKTIVSKPKSEIVKPKVVKKEVIIAEKEVLVEDVKAKRQTLNKKEALAVPAKKKIVPEVKILSSKTIPASSFKSGKLKSTGVVKDFASTYKSGQKVYIIGFSNESNSSFDNYQEGLNMANSVKGYLKKQGISSSSIILNAKKQEKGDNINKGVILQLR